MKTILSILLAAVGIASANSGDTTRLDTLAYGRDTCGGSKTCRYAQVKIHAGPVVLTPAYQLAGTGLRVAIWGTSLSNQSIGGSVKRWYPSISLAGTTEAAQGWWTQVNALHNSPFTLVWNNGQVGYNASQIYTQFIGDTAYVKNFDIGVLEVGTNDIINISDPSTLIANMKLMIAGLLKMDKKIVIIVPAGKANTNDTVFTAQNLYERWADSTAFAHPGKIYAVSNYRIFGVNKKLDPKYTQDSIHFNIAGAVYLSPAWDSTIQSLAGNVPKRNAEDYGKVVGVLTGNVNNGMGGAASSMVYAGLDSFGDSSWTVRSTQTSGLSYIHSDLPLGTLTPGRQYRLYARFRVDSNVSSTGIGYMPGPSLNQQGSSSGVSLLFGGPTSDTLPTGIWYTVLSIPLTAKDAMANQWLIQYYTGYSGTKSTVSKLAVLELPDRPTETLVKQTAIDQIAAGTVTDLVAMPHVYGRTTLAPYEIQDGRKIKVSFDVTDTSGTAIDSISTWIGGTRLFTTGSFGSGVTAQHREETFTPLPLANFVLSNRWTVFDGAAAATRSSVAYSTWTLPLPIHIYFRCAQATQISNFKIELIP